MRTTVYLDDETYQLLRSIADQKQRSIGNVIGDFVREAVGNDQIKKINRTGRRFERLLSELPLDDEADGSSC